MNRFRYRPVLGCLLLLLTGCAAAPKMEFLQQPQNELDAGKSIYLMSVNLKNVYKPDYQPKLFSVVLENAETEKFTGFAVTPDLKTESEDPGVGNRYLTHFSLEPGDYVLRHLVSINQSFLIYGSFATPIHHDLSVTAPGVYYLGNVSGVVRPRQSGEFKAGSSIPLIDQSTVGASGGSWDIEISDQWETDRGDFTALYPALQNIDVKRAVMPSFDRARAQKYWEDH